MFNFYRIRQEWLVDEITLAEGNMPLQKTFLIIHIGSSIRVEWKCLYNSRFHYVATINENIIIEQDVCSLSISSCTSHIFFYKKIIIHLRKIMATFKESKLNEIFEKSFSYAENYFLNTLADNSSYYLGTFITFDLLDDFEINEKKEFKGVIRERVVEDSISFEPPMWCLYLTEDILNIEEDMLINFNESIVTEEILFLLMQENSILADDILQ